MKDLSLHIVELVKNSIRAHANIITVELTEEYTNDRIELSISDNGDGIPSTSLDKVTDPFYTTKTTQRFGLGLALIKQNVEAANGTFKIDSVVGKGTELHAVMKLSHYDCLPTGDMVDAMTSLIEKHTSIVFNFTHRIDKQQYSFCSKTISKLKKDLVKTETLQEKIIETISSNIVNI